MWDSILLEVTKTWFRGWPLLDMVPTSVVVMMAMMDVLGDEDDNNEDMESDGMTISSTAVTP